MRVLLLAANFGAPYRVLRCAAALGAEIHVAGTGPARSLALSRFCKSFTPFSFELGKVAEATARVDACARQVGADMVLPSDFETTKFLARVAPHLSTPVFPLSEAETIVELGTKDRFMQLCRRLNILHPEGMVLGSGAELQAVLKDKRIALPAILKPVDLAGGMGVVRIDAGNAQQIAARIDYAPILAQQFIEGDDRCITLFCCEGAVLKQVVYDHTGGTFRFFKDAALSEVAARIASALNLNGVINFDARIDAAGRVWIIECNPRFYFNMDVAMIAGLNFANWSGTATKGVRSVAIQNVHTPPALLRNLLRLRGVSWQDLRMLWHWLKDPLIFALVAIGYGERWRLPSLPRLSFLQKAPAQAN